MPDNFEILDACSLLNFYASQYLAPILKSRAIQIYIVEQVLQESLYIRKPAQTSPGFEYEQVNLDPYFQSGLIELVSLDTEDEISVFVELAASLDDGEAATIVIAIKRQMTFVTDDRKATRIFNQQNPPTGSLSTLEIIKEWHDREKNDAGLTKTVLQNIFQYANYKPAKSHLLFEWWNTMIR